jgi:hypothetical protein
MEIVILGLESRTDRWDRCKEILQENGIEKVTHYTTQIGVDKYKHAAQDFINLLRLKRGADLMFFEDDFELVTGWRGIFDKAWRDLPSDFDLLYLGCNLTRSPKRVTDNLYRVRGAWCLHGVVFSRQFIDWFLNTYDINQRTVIDEWLRAIAPDRKFYMTYPMICYQRASYSDYVNKEVDYNIFENKYYKKL